LKAFKKIRGRENQPGGFFAKKGNFWGLPPLPRGDFKKNWVFKGPKCFCFLTGPPKPRGFKIFLPPFGKKPPKPGKIWGKKKFFFFSAKENPPPKKKKKEKGAPPFIFWGLAQKIEGPPPRPFVARGVGIKNLTQFLIKFEKKIYRRFPFGVLCQFKKN